MLINKVISNKSNLMALYILLALMTILIACQPVETSAPITLTQQAPTATTIMSTQTTPTPSPTITVTATTTLIPSATPLSTPVTPYPEEWLAFVNRDFMGRTSHPNVSILDVANTTISFVRHDGSALTQPKMYEKFYSMIEYSLVWSPDGQYLLFDWSDFGSTMTRIPVYHLVDLPRKKITQIESNQAWVLPSWSPNSEWFATSLLMPVINQEGNEQYIYNIFALNAHTLQKARLTAGATNDLYPSWSPDGEWIAFLRYAPETLTPKSGSGDQCGSTPDSASGCNAADLYIVHKDGGNPSLLLKSAYIHSDPNSRDSVYNSPSWSPDSKWLAVLTGTEQSDITLVNIETRETRLLAAHPGLDIYPSWSPDGSKLLFVSNREGNEEVYLISPDGNNLVNITNHNGSDYNPLWSPSGRYIAFLSDRDTSRAYKLYIMNSDGTGQLEVQSDYVFSRPTWFPLVGVDLKKFLGFGTE